MRRLRAPLIQLIVICVQVLVESKEDAAAFKDFTLGSVAPAPAAAPEQKAEPAAAPAPAPAGKKKSLSWPGLCVCVWGGGGVV